MRKVRGRSGRTLVLGLYHAGEDFERHTREIQRQDPDEHRIVARR